MFQEAAEKIADGIRPYLEANLQSIKGDSVACLQVSVLSLCFSFKESCFCSGAQIGEIQRPQQHQGGD